MKKVILTLALIASAASASAGRLATQEEMNAWKDQVHASPDFYDFCLHTWYSSNCYVGNVYHTITPPTLEELWSGATLTTNGIYGTWSFN